jgi:hypothetical protein
MKLIITVAAAAVVATWTLTASTPATAQKDPACREKCIRDNQRSGGTTQTKASISAVRACVANCPAAKSGQK